MTKKLSIPTPSRVALIDITAHVEKVVRASSIRNGFCFIFVPHTTAAVTINENADPSVRNDIAKALDMVVPEKASYTHAEGNSPAHVKASLVGTSESIIIDDGALLLGTWQGIYLCEFDGPRERSVIIRVTGGKGT
jgi:secondary thiamine-phosphate synthase enzyme